MNIFSENKGLLELIQGEELTDKDVLSLGEGTIKGFKRAIAIMRAEKRIEGLFRYKGLHYEKLKGVLAGMESVRCDRKYRLIFRSYPDKGSIVITNICLIKISNHYGDL